MPQITQTQNQSLGAFMQAHAQSGATNNLQQAPGNQNHGFQEYNSRNMGENQKMADLSLQFPHASQTPYQHHQSGAGVYNVHPVSLSTQQNQLQPKNGTKRGHVHHIQHIGINLQNGNSKDATLTPGTITHINELKIHSKNLKSGENGKIGGRRYRTPKPTSSRKRTGGLILKSSRSREKTGLNANFNVERGRRMKHAQSFNFHSEYLNQPKEPQGGPLVAQGGPVGARNVQKMIQNHRNPPNGLGVDMTEEDKISPQRGRKESEGVPSAQGFAQTTPNLISISEKSQVRKNFLNFLTSF